MGLIHATALVDPQAELAADVTVGPYAVIGAACAHRRRHAASARTA
jgi:acyl-[acyl carrier protein]--UDP-N-acetylglucosamine O-acyltransferase